MTRCTQCQAPNAQLFSLSGDAICRGCFYGAKTHELERDLPSKLVRGGVTAIMVAIFLVPCSMLVGAMLRERLAPPLAGPTTVIVDGTSVTMPPLPRKTHAFLTILSSLRWVLPGLAMTGAGVLAVRGTQCIREGRRLRRERALS